MCFGVYMTFVSVKDKLRKLSGFIQITTCALPLGGITLILDTLNQNITEIKIKGEKVRTGSVRSVNIPKLLVGSGACQKKRT